MRSNRKVAITSIVLAFAGIGFLVLTNPQTLAPIVLIVPFILFFLSLFFAVIFVTTVITKTDQPTIKRKSFLFSILLAGYPVMLLLLQSIGQLSLRDVITLTLLFGVSALYIGRSSFGTQV
jgi:hypothetical protein